MTPDAPRPTRNILLTGVTGFLGKIVLSELLDREEARDAAIHVLVRESGGQSARERFDAKVRTSAAFGDRPYGWQDRVHVVAGDLALPRCGLSAPDYERLSASVTEIIHCAASVDFDLSLAEACEANATTALEVLELARAAPRLRAMVSVSTAYVTPHHDGAIHEEVPTVFEDPEAMYASIRAGEAKEAELLARTGHPNTYTFTKCLAEQLLGGRRGGVPLRIVRPSIISACLARPSPGWIDSGAALAGFVTLIGAGYMRAVVADPDTTLDVVPCDEVASRVVDEAYRATPRDALRIVHAVASLGRARPVSAIVKIILDHFGEQQVMRAPRIVYLGPRNGAYAYHRMVQHQLPAQLGALWCAVRGDGRGRKRLLRGAEKLDEVNDLFAYFTHRSFDFRTSSPLGADFDPERYFRTICEGISKNLLPRSRMPRGRIAA